MRKYYCDRCQKELDKATHAVVEVQRKRYDLCKSPCLGAFEPFRVKVEKAAQEGALNLRRRITELEDEFWGRMKGGSEKETDRPEAQDR